MVDEASSALDSLAEEGIINMIETCFNSRLNFVLVSHRFSTGMHVIDISVLEKGKIVESRSHGNVIASLYYAMWRQQISER